MEAPGLITFDIFGTVVDWYDGLKTSMKKHQLDLKRETFDRMINYQGSMEQVNYRKYTDISTDSLVKCAGLKPPIANEISRNIGLWPLFPDSREALSELLKSVDCMAISNSDLVHGEQVQRQLGFRLTHWYCAEELRIYKPNPGMWRKVSERQKISLSNRWWHVSAYADFDLEIAKALGLTCVFVQRKHSRPGFSHLQVKDLKELATIVASLKKD